MRIPTTVVMNCAGLGTRLGLGVPKSLLEFFGRPLIQWQLKMLREVHEIRVVVGFKADEVVQAVRAVRNDVIFVYNHQYASTGTAFSLYLGARFVRGDIISLDGDLAVVPADLSNWLAKSGRRIAVSRPTSAQPIYAKVERAADRLQVNGFDRDQGEWEWTGIFRAPASEIGRTTGHVFEMLEDLLPMEADVIRAMDIDTASDFSVVQAQYAEMFKE
jgi:choline kinase